MTERRPPGFNVPLGFHDSDEVLSLPRKIRASAVGVWTLAGEYSANKLTDGYVIPEILKTLGCTPSIRAALMATTPEPLWLNAEPAGAIQFTRWPKWQRTCNEVKTYRHTEAERKRNARKTKRDATTSGDPETSDRTTAGHPPDVRPDSRDPKTKTKTETETRGGYVTLESPVGSDPPPEPPPHSGAGPPDQFCENHMPFGTDENCGACKRHRIQYNNWLAQQPLQLKRLEQAENRNRLAAWRDQIPQCPLCNENGMRLPECAFTCDHVDRRLTNARGAKAVRDAMGWNT